MTWGVQLFYAPGHGEPVHMAEPCGESNEPARHRADSFAITNNTGAAGEKFPGLQCVDLAALWQLAFPATASENLPQLLRELGAPENAEGFSSAWKHVAAHLDSMPLWALETTELTLREAGEETLAGLFNLAARRAQKAGKNCGDWTRSFENRATQTEKRAIPGHSDCSPVDAAELARAVGPGGSFAGVIPGYEAREGQAQMVRAVAGAFNAAQHLAVEAGTGVGKSIGYLLPAAKWALFNDTPVIVSTHMKNLQAQLMDKDIPMLREALARNREPNVENFRVALIKGRGNYLCLRKLGMLLDNGALMFDRPGLRQLARAAMWSAQTPDGDLEAFSGGAGAESDFLRELSSNTDECPGGKCRHFRRCFMRKARDRAGRAHLVLANHALVFVDHNADVSLPSARQIIFDEAHNLEEVATRHFSVEITSARFSKLVSRLSRERGKMSAGILETLRNQIEKGAAGGGGAVQKAMAKKSRLVRAALAEARGAGDWFFNELGRVSQRETRRFRAVAAPPDAAVQPLPPSATLDERVADHLALPQEISRGAAFIQWEAEDRGPVVRAAFEFVDRLVFCAAQLMELASLVREGMKDELTLLGDQAEDLEGASAQLKNFALDLHFALDARDANFVHWIQSSGGILPPYKQTRRQDASATSDTPAAFLRGEIFCAPLDVGPRLAEEIYARADSVVFCSATLRTGGNFNFMGQRLGLNLIPRERLATCLAESPFDYTRQCRVFTTPFLPEPAGEQAGDAYAAALAEMMRGVLIQTGGRGLGLFTSHEMLQTVARLLRAPLEEAGIRVLTQDKGYSRDQITRIFRAGGGCVLLGTHSFWEGVDVVGEALSCVVIARLPFASPGDPVTSARAERVTALGGNAFRDYSVPTAVIRFRQGFGRLIRSRSDRGVVIVADPRIENKFYGRWFKQSLPCPCATVDAMENLLAGVGAFFNPDCA